MLPGSTVVSLFWVKLLYPHLGCSKSEEDQNRFYRDSDEKVMYVIDRVSVSMDCWFFRQDTDTKRWHLSQRLEEFP